MAQKNQHERIKCVFASMVLGVSILFTCFMYFLNTLKSNSSSIYFWRNYKQPSYLTTISFKVIHGNFEGYRDQIVNNRTILKKGNIVHIVQRQYNSKPITTIMSNITQKRYFLCNGPTGRLGNQLFDFASSLGMANTCKYV